MTNVPFNQMTDDQISDTYGAHVPYVVDLNDILESHGLDINTYSKQEILAFTQLYHLGLFSNSKISTGEIPMQNQIETLRQLQSFLWGFYSEVYPDSTYITRDAIQDKLNHDIGEFDLAIEYFLADEYWTYAELLRFAASLDERLREEYEETPAATPVPLVPGLTAGSINTL